MKTHAHPLRGLELIVQPGAVGPQVVVIAAGGAAAQEQFGQCQLGADLHVRGCQFGPDGVEGLEPVEEHRVLCGGNDAGEGLVEVVVGVDKAGQHQLAPGVNALLNFGGELHRQVFTAPHPENLLPVDEQRAVGDLPALGVHCDEGCGVMQEGEGHGSGFLCGK